MNSPENAAELLPVKKTVAVPLDRAGAFSLFTERIGTWWPLAIHSVGQEKAESVIMESGVGGRIVERYDGDNTAVWGTVLEWDPPRRLAFSWHPGKAPHDNHLVEVEFTSEGEGTSVTLTHSGWAWLGAEAATMRSNYDGGWEGVLGRFQATASGS